MGLEAAKVALTRANVSANEIDLLIVATLSPDMPFPSTACLIQNKLGLRPIASFDIQAACSGFLYALEVASKMMLSGNYKNALVIGSEKMSGKIGRASCRERV